MTIVETKLPARRKPATKKAIAPATKKAIAPATKKAIAPAKGVTPAADAIARGAAKPVNKPLATRKQENKKTIQEITNKIQEKLLEAPKVKKVSIKDFSCTLLCEVVRTNDEGRTVGLAYEDVLAQVLAEFPGAKTSLNCLRWYAGKIRSQYSGFQKYTLPQVRERKKVDHSGSELQKIEVQ